MSREEAIKELTELLPEEFLSEYADAIKMGIEALEQEPCDDCVSRQQAIDKMQELEEEDIEAYGCSIPEGFDGKMAIEALKALSSVHQKPKMGWIPVSERLPESCGMYIVTRKIYDCPDTAPIIMSDESWFDGQNTWHNDNRINHERRYLSDVIAWCKLPTPYQSEISTGAEGSEE